MTAEGAPSDLREALESLRNTMAFDPRDWGQDKRDAWLYGIVFGWDGEAMAELITQHHWAPGDVARLRRYARAVEAFVSDISLTPPKEVTHAD